LAESVNFGGIHALQRARLPVTHYGQIKKEIVQRGGAQHACHPLQRRELPHDGQRGGFDLKTTLESPHLVGDGTRPTWPMLPAPPHASKCKSSNNSVSNVSALVAIATERTPKDCWNFCSPDLAELQSRDLHGLRPLSSRSLMWGVFSEVVLDVRWACSPDTSTQAPARRWFW
jgi:hypothetical protein